MTKIETKKKLEKKDTPALCFGYYQSLLAFGF